MCCYPHFRVGAPVGLKIKRQTEFHPSLFLPLLQSVSGTLRPHLCSRSATCGFELHFSSLNLTQYLYFIGGQHELIRLSFQVEHRRGRGEVCLFFFPFKDGSTVYAKIFHLDPFIDNKIQGPIHLAQSDQQDI